VADLDPDLDRLRAATDRLGLLGCYVYSVPAADGRLAARMFAPSIGVPEDIANANSTACLAAHLAGAGRADIAVDMGDSLGSPATVTATARPGPAGPWQPGNRHRHRSPGTGRPADPGRRRREDHGRPPAGVIRPARRRDHVAPSFPLPAGRSASHRHAGRSVSRPAPGRRRDPVARARPPTWSNVVCGRPVPTNCPFRGCGAPKPSTLVNAGRYLG